MKQANVVVGATYECRIGAELARVIVEAEVKDSQPHWDRYTRIRDGYKITTKFRVRREGESVCLPKLRSAAALRMP
jgi:hypothetical protein